MIAKVEVRKTLATYEKKIRQEIENTREEIRKMEESCATVEMIEIFRQSKRYAELFMKYSTLFNVLRDIIDIRCDEQFND